MNRPSLMCSIAALPRASEYSPMATMAPSRAKACAIARPLPDPPPVTIATRPSNLPMAAYSTGRGGPLPIRVGELKPDCAPRRPRWGSRRDWRRCSRCARWAVRRCRSGVGPQDQRGARSAAEDPPGHPAQQPDTPHRQRDKAHPRRRRILGHVPHDHRQVRPQRMDPEPHTERQGVECRTDPDVIDESPACYKNIDDVMRAQADLTKPVHALKQIVVVK